MEKQSISAVRLTAFIVDKEGEYVEVYLSARLSDYTTNREGAVVEGVKHKTYYRDYRLRFKRVNSYEKSSFTPSCLNCGDPIALGASGRCNHCGATIKAEHHDWVLDDYREW